MGTGEAKTKPNTVGGRRETDRNANNVWRRGRGRDRKPDFVACSARIVSGWVVVA